MTNYQFSLNSDSIKNWKIPGWLFYKDGLAFWSHRYSDLAVLASLIGLVFITKIEVLEIPYYWDEMGYVRAANSLSQYTLMNIFPGVGPPDQFWGHPPALYLVMALLYRLFGISTAITHILSLSFATIGLYFTYRLGSLLQSKKAGLLAALFLFSSPIYFAQSGMFLADVPVAAFGVMSVFWALKGRYLPYLLSALFLVLIKETAMAVVMSIALYKFWSANEHRIGESLKYGAPLLAIAAFMAAQKITTGSFCCIYGFEISIVSLSPGVMINNLLLQLKWLLIMQNRWIFLLLIVICFIWQKSFRSQRELLLFLMIFAGFILPFTGLYFLPRYIMPMLPFLCLMAVMAIFQLMRNQTLRMLVAISTIFLLITTSWDIHSKANYEWNMRYSEVVDVHQKMVQFIAAKYPTATVLTVFPHVGQLRFPYLGYVSKPINAVPFTPNTPKGDDFDLVMISTQSHIPKNSALAALVQTLVPVKRFGNDHINATLYAKLDTGS